MKIELPAQEIDINPIELIAALSLGFEDAQAAFINLFAESFQKNIESEHRFQGVQTCGIAENLNPQGREFIKALAEFIKIIEEKPTK